MTQLYTLGEAKTIPAENMTVDNAIDNLSDNATEILCFVAEELLENNKDNEMGVRIQHAPTGQDFKTQNVDELFSYGVVTVHPSSADGVMYMHMNRDVYQSLVDFGEIEELEELEDELIENNAFEVKEVNENEFDEDFELVEDFED